MSNVRAGDQIVIRGDFPEGQNYVVTVKTVTLLGVDGTPIDPQTVTFFAPERGPQGRLQFGMPNIDPGTYTVELFNSDCSQTVGSVEITIQ